MLLRIIPGLTSGSELWERGFFFVDGIVAVLFLFVPIAVALIPICLFAAWAHLNILLI